MDIQKAFEMHEWGQESGQSPIVWAPYVRTYLWKACTQARSCINLQTATSRPTTPIGPCTTVTTSPSSRPDDSEEHGTVFIHPEPARFFEVPVVGPLPESLNYIR